MVKNVEIIDKQFSQDCLYFAQAQHVSANQTQLFTGVQASRRQVSTENVTDFHIYLLCLSEYLFQFLNIAMLQCRENSHLCLTCPTPSNSK